MEAFRGWVWGERLREGSGNPIPPRGENPSKTGLGGVFRTRAPQNEPYKSAYPVRGGYRPPRTPPGPLAPGPGGKL